MSIFNNAPVDAASVQNILSVGREGFAKGCRFAVMITPPRVLLSSRQGFGTASFLRDLIFLCEAAELAGRGLQTMDARYYGPSFKLPFMSTYNDMNLTFICRNDQKEKRFFDKWVNAINPNNSYNFEYRDNYATNISIFSFDESDRVNYQQILEKAYPVIVNPINTTWADDQISRLNVTFTYKQYRTKDDPLPLETYSLRNDFINGAFSTFDSVPFLGDPFISNEGRP